MDNEENNFSLRHIEFEVVEMLNSRVCTFKIEIHCQATFLRDCTDLHMQLAASNTDSSIKGISLSLIPGEGWLQ